MARQVLPIVGAAVGGYLTGWSAQGMQWGYAIGSVIGNAVDPQVIKGPKLGEAGLQTSAEGVFRPIVFGTGAVKGNVICRGNRQVKKKREQQGKGGPVTETERVYWTWAIRICEGPIAAVLRIWQDEKLVYDIRPESTIVAESTEFAQRLRIYFGDETQLPDPDLEAFKGVGNVPAYRGTCYAVFPNFDLTDTGERIPDFRFEVAAQGEVTPAGMMMAQPRATEPIVSADGITWTLCANRANLSNNDLQAVNNGRFIASNRYTDDFGVTAWATATTIGLGLRNFQSTHRGDDVVFGASGPFSPPVISFDNGTTQANGGVSGNGIYAPVYVADTTKIIAVGKLNNFVNSTDNGATFSDTGSPHGFNTQNIHNVCCKYSGGAVFAGRAAGTDPGEIRVVFTTSGVSFTGGNITGLGSASTGTGKGCSRICAGVIGGVETVVLLGSDGGPELFWTQDEGTNWHLIANPLGVGVELDAIAWNGARFVLGGVTGSTGVLKHSTDLATWADCVMPSGSQGYFAIASQTPGAGNGYGEKIALSSIVSTLCERPGLPIARFDVSELTDMVDGLVLADDYTYADAIRALMPVYFYGASEHDAGDGYKLHFPKHGKPVVTTLTIDDFVSVPDKTVRQDAYERPRVLHMHYQSPTVGYAPAKASPMRFSPDVKVVGEQSIQVPVSFKDQDEAWQRADKILKIVWTGIAGEEEFSLPMSFLRLVPTDAVGISLRGQVRRMVFGDQSYAAGVISCKLVSDRQGNYTSNLTGIPLPPPTPPPPSIVGPSIMAFGDWPALNDNNDRLLYYVGVTGQTEAWHGAQVDRSTDGGANFTQASAFAQNTIMGVLQEDVTAASRFYTDTTNVIRVHLYLDDEIESLSDAQFNSEGGAFMLSYQDSGATRWEMIQYRDAEQDSNGDWLLTTLKRGQLNTDPVDHATGDVFVLLDGVQSVDAVTAWLNTELTHRATSAGRSPDGVPTQTDEFTGASQREFPVASVGLSRDGDDITVSIIPRHRFGTESNPIRSINWERYSLEISDGVSVSVIGTTSDTFTFDASAMSSPLTVSVAQRNRLTGDGPAVSESIA